MFKLQEDETFKWPISAKVPVNGKYETVKFTAVFSVLSTDEIVGMNADDENAGTNLLRRVLVKFEDEDFQVEGADDDDSRNALLLSKPYMVRPLIDGFNKGLSGYRAKN